MRGPWKAAALLAANVVSGLVIPQAGALDGPPAEPIIEYDPSEAQLKFVINSVEPAWGYPVLTLDVGPSQRLCAESNIRLDGQQLDSTWNGFQGVGHGTLSAYGNARMAWTITCLWDSGNGDTVDITHFLTVKLLDSVNRHSLPAFTVSFKSLEHPSIVRFEPHDSIPPSSNSDYPEWRTPSLPFANGLSASARPTTPGSSSQPESPLSPKSPSLWETQFRPQDFKQKSLSSQLETVTDKIKKKVSKLIEKIKNLKPCPKAYLKQMKSKPTAETTEDLPEDANEPETTHHDEIVGSDIRYQADRDDSYSTPTRQPPAAQTRALHSDATSTGIASLSTSADHNGIPSAVILKSFFLSLTLLALLTWIILRCRDPRRRADRAAQREERRTKRLYRRAARRQAFRNWVWTVRLKYGLLFPDQIREEEKQRRVAEQDAFLEDVMKDDLHVLRNAHGTVSALTGASFAAEEGRSGFSLGPEAGESGHRRLRSVRSVCTLPGYESEGTQPPSYDDLGRRASVTEFTSNSSVISTSPRISQDGTNSDYNEKIEEIDLNAGNLNGLRSS